MIACPDSTNMNEMDHRRVEMTELKLLTVVFWDIDGFSNLCYILSNSPESIIGFLSEYYGLVEKVVSANGGVVNKFIGDGVMALFGLNGHESDDGTNDAISAVKAAINLKDSFQQIESEWRKIWERKVSEKIDIGLKCGINTGEVIVAKVWTERSQYTAIGTVVNYASRFEGLAKDNQILMS